ncbi:MAG: aminotransferase class IV [Planctomycetes bacterium]|nr:aminotransferase class IV [Planctomycetota bacterium]
MSGSVGWTMIRAIVWVAEDPNDDRLSYSLSFRGEGEKAWKPLARGLRETYFAFDSMQMPDGLYEVTPAYKGRLFRFEQHMGRLRHGLDALRITYDTAGLPEMHQRLLAENDLEGEDVSIVYLQITRGVAPRTHHFPPEGTLPTVYAFAKAFHRPDPERWEQGYSAITVPDRRWARVDLKTIGLLANVLVQQAAVDAGAATAGCQELAERFPDRTVELIHGQLAAADKDTVMRRFLAGEIDVLVATTVIEVGIDVSNATVMFIEHAERFGLAQLHQLRGRVGRGAEQSWCIAFYGGAKAPERLGVFAATTDGFRIAEEDLRLRGQGDFFGAEQHGVPGEAAARGDPDQRHQPAEPAHAGERRRVQRPSPADIGRALDRLAAGAPAAGTGAAAATLREEDHGPQPLLGQLQHAVGLRVVHGALCAGEDGVVVGHHDAARRLPLEQLARRVGGYGDDPLPAGHLDNQRDQVGQPRLVGVDVVAVGDPEGDVDRGVFPLGDGHGIGAGLDHDGLGVSRRARRRGGREPVGVVLCQPRQRQRRQHRADGALGDRGGNPLQGRHRFVEEPHVTGRLVKIDQVVEHHPVAARNGAVVGLLVPDEQVVLVGERVEVPAETVVPEPLPRRVGERLGRVEPPRLLGGPIQRHESSYRQRVVLQDGIDPRVALAVRAKQAAGAVTHRAEHEVGGATRRVDVFRVPKHATAIGHPGDHETVPTGDDLVVKAGLLAQVACPQQRRVDL